MEDYIPSEIHFWDFSFLCVLLCDIQEVKIIFLNCTYHYTPSVKTFLSTCSRACDCNDSVNLVSLWFVFIIWNFRTYMCFSYLMLHYYYFVARKVGTESSILNVWRQTRDLHKMLNFIYSIFGCQNIFPRRWYLFYFDHHYHWSMWMIIIFGII